MASGEPAVANNPTDKPNELLLYFHDYSFFSQKVLMVLHEKDIKYKAHFVNIASGEQYQDWYLKINPLGEVPVIKDGDTIIVDSQRIIMYLEDKYTGESHPRLIPTDEGADIIEKHNHFHTIIHDIPAEVITVGSFYHTEFVRSPKLPFIYPARRHMKLSTERAPAKLKALIESGNAASEALKQKVERLEKHIAIMKDKEEYKKVLETLDKVLDEVEQQLWENQGEPDKWLVSERFTLADIDLTILLERLNVIGMDERAWGNSKRPCIAKFWNRVRQRPSYKAATPSAFFHVKTMLQGITFLAF